MNLKWNVVLVKVWLWLWHDFHISSYFLMTFTAQALLSLSFLACTPLQQVSILVAEDVNIRVCVILLYRHNKTAQHILHSASLPASFCFLNSPFALYPLYLAWSLVAANSEHNIKVWLCNERKWIINGSFELTQLVFTFLVSILCGVKRPWMTDEYFGAITNGNNTNAFACLWFKVHLLCCI